MRRAEHRYRTVASVAGPLLFVNRVFEARIGEMVRIERPDGGMIEGEVLEIDGDRVLVQMFGDTRGLDIGTTTVAFTDAVRTAPLSRGVLGRVFDGAFRPVDGLPSFVPLHRAPIGGRPINPSARARPEEFIETGISCIDGLNTLVKGQKLPVFTCAGLPSKEIVADILRNARLSVTGREFCVVFAAIGLTFHEYAFYMDVLREVRGGLVAFVNRADDPVMERLMTPRLALTTAEYLGFELGMDVLVVMTDMVNYCEALREISTAREELPGRRGYPGYLYSDLASLYERAGRITGLPGSVTVLPVVTMPEDDITHPIPDLTGYITEGQIVLSREMHRTGIYPPVDVLPSLSRLMQNGIGDGRTRADHRKVANALYRAYARGRDLRRLESIVGRDGMTAADRRMLEFADGFERQFVGQGRARRTIAETLDMGIALLHQWTTEQV